MNPIPAIEVNKINIYAIQCAIIIKKMLRKYSKKKKWKNVDKLNTQDLLLEMDILMFLFVVLNFGIEHLLFETHRNKKNDDKLHRLSSEN